MKQNIQKTHDLCKKALSLKNQIETAFIALGKLLFDIKNSHSYEQEYETWVLFLMEMKITEGTASKLMKIYEVFVLGYEIPEEQIAGAGGWTVVYDIIPLATNKKQATEWIKKAGMLTRTDIQREILEVKTGKKMAECEHEWTKIKRCSVCGIRCVDNELE